jgi:uncharacterized membrane protein YfcA
MDPLLAIGIFLAAFVAGMIGSLFGVGGGIIIIPALTLLFGVPFQEAIGASLVGVIATSTGAASRYVSAGIVNIRLGMIMEPATTFGSIIGAAIAIYLDQAALAAIFALLMIYSAYYMIKKPEVTIHTEVPEGLLSDLSGTYYDPKEQKEIKYNVRNLKRGILASLVAGNMSGLLGVGGGLVKVPVMNVWMGVPIRAATATSNFMIGVTALAGAAVFYVNGLISPVLTAVVAVGVFSGALLGSRVSGRAGGGTIRKYFAVLMIAISVLMLLRAAGIYVGV